jgi:hypothetical protein
MVMTAAAIAAHALTDTEQKPDTRLRALMEAHGKVLAARGIGTPLTFTEFRKLLLGDLSELLPPGVPAAEMGDVHLITADGEFEEDIYDLEQEQRAVLRALAATTRGGTSTSSDTLQAELDQDRVYSALRKRLNQAEYQHGRRALIDKPAGTEGELRRLNLPSSVAEFYKPISAASIYDRWWFACPLCRWPMKITIRRSKRGSIGSAWCLHRPHVEFGATYSFKIPDTGNPPVLVPGPAPSKATGSDAVLFPDVTGQVPEPQPVDKHMALTRGVWRWTTIPGLVEIALYDALVARGLSPILWPDLDAYDLHVDVATPSGTTVPFRVDVKDFTSSLLLAKKIQADEGDAGGADWLVVPDYRGATVSMLGRVCEEFGLKVAKASTIGTLICEAAGTSWV